MVSHGNFLFGQEWSQQTQEGVLLELAFDGTDLVQARMHPYVMLEQAQTNLTDPETDGLYVLNRIYEASGLPVRKLAPDALALFQSASWPGNVRQLRNVLEWLLIMAPGDPRAEIGVDSLPPELIEETTASLNPSSNGELMVMPIREAREHFERAYLQAQLERFSGNISRTAGFVGMERSALHRKLKSLNISADG